MGARHALDLERGNGVALVCGILGALDLEKHHARKEDVGNMGTRGGFCKDLISADSSLHGLI